MKNFQKIIISFCTIFCSCSGQVKFINYINHGTGITEKDSEQCEFAQKFIQWYMTSYLYNLQSHENVDKKNLESNHNNIIKDMIKSRLFSDVFLHNFEHKDSITISYIYKFNELGARIDRMSDDSAISCYCFDYISSTSSENTINLVFVNNDNLYTALDVIKLNDQLLLTDILTSP